MNCWMQRNLMILKTENWNLKQIKYHDNWKMLHSIDFKFTFKNYLGVSYTNRTLQQH